MSDAQTEQGIKGQVRRLTASVQALVERVRYLTTRFSLGRWEDLSRLELVLVYPPILIIQVFRELIHDRGLVRASSLAFTTALSVVPLLTVATTLSGAFGVGNKTVLGMLKTMLPVSGDRITDQLSEFSQHQGGALSGIGSVVLIFLGVAMFNNIEQAFNDIWRIRARRPLVSKFLTFYALITLAPLMITISVVESARVQFVMDEMPFFSSVGYKLLPLGLAVVAFTLANKLLPHTEVKWVPALVSGFVTAIAFEVAKSGFNIYVTHFVMESYATVYGAISLIPLFLIWVYVSWVIVLFGAEMTYTIQNLRTLLLPQRLHDINKDEERRLNPLIGLEIFTPVASAFHAGQGPVPMIKMAAIAGVPMTQAREIVERLLKHRILLEVDFLGADGSSTGYIPGRSLSDISVIDVLQACRDPLKDDAQSPFMHALLTLHRSREAQLFGALNCAGLVEENNTDRLRLMADALAVDQRDRVGAGRTPARGLSEINSQLTRAAQLLHPGEPTQADSPPSPIDALAALGVASKPRLTEQG